LDFRFFLDVFERPKTEGFFVGNPDASFGRTRNVEQYRVETVSGKTLEIDKRVDLDRSNGRSPLETAIMRELIETYLVFFKRDDFPSSRKHVGDLSGLRTRSRAHVKNPGSRSELEKPCGNEAGESLDVYFSRIVGVASFERVFVFLRNDVRPRKAIEPFEPHAFRGEGRFDFENVRFQSVDPEGSGAFGGESREDETEIRLG
jgi:hypothetical protein